MTRYLEDLPARGFADHDHPQPEPGCVHPDDVAAWIAQTTGVPHDTATLMLEVALVAQASYGHVAFRDPNHDLIDLRTAGWAADAAVAGLVRAVQAATTPVIAEQSTAARG
ncbi:hypothetical protein Xcel_2061 [Xylanimonas cellulosilytica DSM 15894]|uniref:Uncharacterized protein n=1 Tax=Xylanimonas cellulosilytica (strain DSM 15894 / JCM 12276 / CECT 5975 / KCTC 9989 / LMG 20990 / NBRC 107835 / XIL07) TaxID=446471 RepID=D1BU66_XYLCX|nr:hypothetical protein [Xylanimonas cellulosilytica]ACZ31079.1 hypothetical protein Xcel_2061 [Xylanimonas cellulosilytica DSM 15894]